MKRLIALFVFATTFLCACSLVPSEPPAECAESVLYKCAPWSFATLKAGQIAARQFMSAEEYATASKAASLVADELEAGADWRKAKSMPYWSRLIAADVLPLLFDPDRIDECDRKYLIGFLRSW